MTEIKDMHVSEAGLDELKESEAYRQYAYPDPAQKLAKTYPKAPWGFKPAAEILAGLPASAATLEARPWTVGYGEATGIKMTDTRTLAEADANLRKKAVRYENLVKANLTRVSTQEQFDALVSIAWNVESAVSASSSIIKKHNAGDFKGAADAFLLYDKVRVGANLVRSEGLANRRKKERSLYLRGSV